MLKTPHLQFKGSKNGAVIKVKNKVAVVKRGQLIWFEK